MRSSIGWPRHVSAHEAWNGVDYGDNTANHRVGKPSPLVIDLEPREIERKKAQRSY
jgi:hypothetical protein